jgi:D-tyrosyl-tRNA(Tyr) deacylase
MRAVIQRVLDAEVKVEDQSVGQIGKGLLVYLSVGKADTLKDAEFVADKIVNLRIFADEAGKMNRSVLDVGGQGEALDGSKPTFGGQILLVSNFTLHGDCRKGRRPGFDAAAEPTLAQQLYEKVAELVGRQGVKVEKGIFGEYMQVGSINDGPVTFLLDSSRLF